MPTRRGSRAFADGPLRARRAPWRGAGRRRHRARPARRDDHRARLRRTRARAAAQRRAPRRPAVRVRAGRARRPPGSRRCCRGAAAATDDPLVRRYRFAEPRIALGRALRGRASAAMDVSDGLLGDLGKLCAASGAGARARPRMRLPVSAELARRHARADCERLVLSGGDDYELLFTLPVAAAAQRWRRVVSGAADCIASAGSSARRRGVHCLRDGRPGDRARRRL